MILQEELFWAYERVAPDEKRLGGDRIERSDTLSNSVAGTTWLLGYVCEAGVRLDGIYDSYLRWTVEAEITRKQSNR